jgi:glycosyltransferase involved in cell wall biosynthesis
MNTIKKTTGIYSIVIPVFNGEKSIEELYERVKIIFNQIDKKFEIIFVDDNSKDNSFEVLCKLHEKYNNVKIIQLARNFGQHKALLCGMHYINGEYVITMDDDLQHPPEEIPKLIDAMDRNPEMDVVIGKYDTKRHNLIRNLGTKMTNRFTSMIFKKDKNLKLTSFRLMKGYIVEALLESQTITPRIGTMLLQVNSRILNINVHHETRKYGRSGYSYNRLVKDFFNNIITNSDWPLRVVGKLGILSCIGSFGLALYYVSRYFIRGISIAGWTTLTVLLLFFSGLILLSLGILGNYMILILKETKKMPLYVIRDIKL